MKARPLIAYALVTLGQGIIRPGMIFSSYHAARRFQKARKNRVARVRISEI